MTMRLKIWHKMIVGISIPSLIAVLGGLLTYGYINDVKNRQGFVQIADDLKERVLEVRRNEKNFIQYKNDAHLSSLQNAMSSLSGSINRIPTNTVEEIGQEEIKLLTHSIQRHLSLINRMNTSYQDEAKISEKVRREGKKLETLVSEKKHAGELTPSFILRLKLLEKNYMFLRDRDSYLQLNRGISQIKNITPFCNECAPYMKAIRDLFDVYEKSDLVLNDLQRNGTRLEDVSGRIAVRERQKINSFIVLTQRLLLAALVLLFILGPFFVYKTASYIAAPIKRLAEITRKISDGDITLRAPLKEHDETYSLAVSFNTMLDNLLQTQKSLEKSMILLREKQAQLVESEKRASLGILVAGVAHELNNPLNNISLSAETMREDLKELSMEELRSNIQDILMQSARAHSIIENLLDFASARRATIMEKLDIIRVIKDSLNLVARQLKMNNIELVQKIPDEEAYFIKGNRSKLEQILISIIINAIQAMKDSGTLHVGIEPEGNSKKVLVKISDTGHGIPESDLKNIFEPFFTTKSPGEGTGLGLSVSRTLVTEHNGELDVESKVGTGTTFTITLPLYEDSV